MSLVSYDGDVILSVRGEAQKTVEPDSVVLAGSIAAAETSKAEALRTATAALGSLTGELAALGGVPLTVETGLSALTWSAYSATTQVERDHNPDSGRFEATGRILASVEVRVAVRDFRLLDTLGRTLAQLDRFNVRRVTWQIDDDNPAWPAVRASAIQAAVRKGRDYASALGGTLTRVEHIADVGLLGGGDQQSHVRGYAAAARSASAGGEDTDAPALDPVPQELFAVIEARFGAAGVSLTGI